MHLLLQWCLVERHSTDEAALTLPDCSRWNASLKIRSFYLRKILLTKTITRSTELQVQMRTTLAAWKQRNTIQTFSNITVTYQFRFEVAYCVFIQLKVSSLPVFHLPEMNTDITLLFLRMSNVNHHLIILIRTHNQKCQALKTLHTTLPTWCGDKWNFVSLWLPRPWTPNSTFGRWFSAFSVWFYHMISHF